MTDDELMNEMLSQIPSEILEKYGDPRDMSNPLNHRPTVRAERFPNLSLEDRIKLLESDTELHQQALARLAAQVLKDVMGTLKDAIGARTLPTTPKPGPEDFVMTMNGPILVKDIPGYQPGPDWVPDPTWIDANCPCDEHQAMRDSKNGPTGMYL